MLKPHSDRVLVKPIFQNGHLVPGGLIEPELLKAGEDIFVGKVVDAGDSDFDVDQIVYYSEYSAAMVFDFAKLLAGTETVDDAHADTNIFVLVAKDDIMAYEDTKVVINMKPIEPEQPEVIVSPPQAPAIPAIEEHVGETPVEDPTHDQRNSK